ncbi:MAG: tRNA dimethylallyltransferase [Ignavibacteriae bacterium]|nr:MAG: tRNA dimethylallyltransferase [Ignavibacteriota bacterium]
MDLVKLSNSKKVLFIIGPTCSGKSTISIPIALKLNAEIISADSRQIYRMLDIGTAKPSSKDLDTVKHHFINELNPDEEFSAGEYSKEARKRIDEIFLRKKQPIVVGGSGLYIEALVDGIFDSPPVDKNIRKKLYDWYRTSSLDELIEYLRKIDSESLQKMKHITVRRVVRAIEVYELTGIPISVLQKQRKPAEFNEIMIGLNWDREKLYERINTRVDWMIESGLIEEVRKILESGYNENLLALQTVGYKETIDYLKGKIDFDKMVELIKRNTRRYAKRQLTWFRREKRIKWFDVKDENDFGGLVEKIIEYFVSS